MIKIRTTGRLLVSSDVETVMQQWRMDSDPLYEFIAWGFNSNTDKKFRWYSKQKLHDAYLKYCIDMGIPIEKQKTTLKSFTQAIHELGFIPREIQENKTRYQVYETLSHIVNPDSIPDLSYVDSNRHL